MKRTIALIAIPIALLAVAGCGTTSTSVAPEAVKAPASYAIYAEYARDSNKLMKNGLNRRLFNKVEAQAGSDISLAADGSITLEPGTYRITGFSTVTMQSTFAPATMKNNNNYPGYAMVYPTAHETESEVLKNAIVIGSGQTALNMAPSDFDVVYTVPTRTTIAVGHQAGDELHDEVYLSIYDVQGAKSDYHLFARVSIFKM